MKWNLLRDAVKRRIQAYSKHTQPSGCPICHGKGESFERDGIWYVECPSCGIALTTRINTKADVVSAWLALVELNEKLQQLKGERARLVETNLKEYGSIAPAPGSAHAEIVARTRDALDRLTTCTGSSYFHGLLDGYSKASELLDSELRRRSVSSEE